jgi:hypothetical protein
MPLLLLYLVFAAIGVLSASSSGGPTGFRAELASPSLSRPLQSEQEQELLQGFAYLSNTQYAEAAAIISKYAFLGDRNSQFTIGGM